MTAKINGKLKEQKYDGVTTKRVAIKGEPFEQLAWSIRPTYDDAGPNEVTLYRLGQEIDVIPNICYGDVIDLVYNKKTDAFRARKVELPTNKEELILWLFDLPKKSRAKSNDEYRKILEERMMALCKDGEAPVWQKEYVIAGGKLAFAQKSIGSNPVCLTGRILGGLADESILEIIRHAELKQLFAYEDITVREILKSRFGLTQADFNEAKF